MKTTLMETNSIYNEAELRDCQTCDFDGYNLKKQEVDFVHGVASFDLWGQINV